MNEVWVTILHIENPLRIAAIPNVIVQFVHAQQSKVHVVHLPAALRILNAVLAEIAGLDQVFRLLLKLRGHRQGLAVEAAERCKISQLIHSDQRKAAVAVGIQTLQEIQIFHIRHAVEIQISEGKVLKGGKRVAARYAERIQLLPV